jgi:hypothetical protein
VGRFLDVGSWSWNLLVISLTAWGSGRLTRVRA